MRPVTQSIPDLADMFSALDCPGEGLAEPDLRAALQELGGELAKDDCQARFVLIGGAALVLAGQPGRKTRGIDIWFPGSIVPPAIQIASVRIGFSKLSLEIKPYINPVPRGLVDLGHFQPLPLAQYGALEILRAPTPNLIASKLRRASAQDLVDIEWLLRSEDVDLLRLAEVVASFEGFPLAVAQDNLSRIDQLVNLRR